MTSKVVRRWDQPVEYNPGGSDGGNAYPANFMKYYCKKKKNKIKIIEIFTITAQVWVKILFVIMHSSVGRCLQMNA